MLAIRSSTAPGDFVTLKGYPEGTIPPFGEVVGYNAPLFTVEWIHPVIPGYRDREVKTTGQYHPDLLKVVGFKSESVPVVLEGQAPASPTSPQE